MDLIKCGATCLQPSRVEALRGAEHADASAARIARVDRASPSVSPLSDPDGVRSADRAGTPPRATRLARSGNAFSIASFSVVLLGPQLRQVRSPVTNAELITDGLCRFPQLCPSEALYRCCPLRSVSSRTPQSSEEVSPRRSYTSSDTISFMTKSSRSLLASSGSCSDFSISSTLRLVDSTRSITDV